MSKPGYFKGFVIYVICYAFPRPPLKIGSIDVKADPEEKYSR
jgi:hypothetical protein